MANSTVIETNAAAPCQAQRSLQTDCLSTSSVTSLTKTTQEKWEESLPTDKLPKWTDMATFLEEMPYVGECGQCCKQKSQPAGDSYHRALEAFKSLEAKLEKDKQLKEQYTAFLQEYIDLGHMSLACKPAAFLAIRAMHQLACDEEDFQLAAKIVCGNFMLTT
ncbi:hypothetical protein ACLKA7_004933 [Drosophila subpalustris]